MTIDLPWTDDDTQNDYVVRIDYEVPEGCQPHILSCVVLSATIYDCTDYGFELPTGDNWNKYAVEKGRWIERMIDCDEEITDKLWKAAQPDPANAADAKRKQDIEGRMSA